MELKDGCLPINIDVQGVTVKAELTVSTIDLKAKACGLKWPSILVKLGVCHAKSKVLCAIKLKDILGDTH